MSVTNFNSGNCNGNPLDYRCFCFSNGPSEYYKIFDIASREYICCGNISFEFTNNSPNPLSTNDVTNNTILNVALSDDPRCLGWWNGSANHFQGLSGTIPPIPQIGTEWYLPDSTTTSNGLYPSSYGPSTHDIQMLMNQSLINSAVTFPSTTVSGTGTQLECPTDSTKPNNKAYWLRQINPNNRQLEYTETLVCADLDYVRSTQAFNDANFALFNVNCTTSTTSNSNICSIPVGEVTNTGSATLGNVALNSKQYGGGTVPLGTPSPKPFYEEAWFWILIVVLVILVIVIIVIWVYLASKSKKVE